MIRLEAPSPGPGAILCYKALLFLLFLPSHEGKGWEEMLIIILQPLGTNTVIHGVRFPLPLKSSTTGLVAQPKWSEPAQRGVTGKSENVIGKKQRQLLLTSSSPHTASPGRVPCSVHAWSPTQL